MYCISHLWRERRLQPNPCGWARNAPREAGCADCVEEGLVLCRLRPLLSDSVQLHCSWILAPQMAVRKQVAKMGAAWIGLQPA
jgi:hypothetical protein